MPDYVSLIAELKKAGFTAKGIAAFGRKKGRIFTHHAIYAIVTHKRTRIRYDIKQTIEELSVLVL